VVGVVQAANKVFGLNIERNNQRLASLCSRRRTLKNNFSAILHRLLDIVGFRYRGFALRFSVCV